MFLKFEICFDKNGAMLYCCDINWAGGSDILPLAGTPNRTSSSVGSELRNVHFGSAGCLTCTANASREGP